MTAPVPGNRTWHINVRTLFVVGIVLLIVLGALALLFPAAKEQPGDPDVYSRIETTTDCRALQGEFNAAEARHGAFIRTDRIDQAEIETSYMEAADERMKKIGCY